MSDKDRINVSLVSEITLRGIARRMNRLDAFNTASNIATEPVLTFLKSGELRSYIQYPSEIVRTINIPSVFWQEISHADFKRIRYKKSNKHSGKFEVGVSCFFDKYLDTLFSSASSYSLEEIRSDIRQVRDHFDEDREVLVGAEVWAEFLDSGGHVEPPPPPPKVAKGGRHEDQGWVHLMPYLVSEAVRCGGEIPVQKEFVGRVFSSAANAGEKKLPSETTVIKHVSKIIKALQPRAGDEK